MSGATIICGADKAQELVKQVKLSSDQLRAASLQVQNSSKTTKKFFTFDVSTSIRGLHQKKQVLGLLLPVLGAIS